MKKATMKKKKTFKYYDSIGVRAFVKYADSNGQWKIEVQRKNQKPKDDSDWKMIREGFIGTFPTRESAEKAALTFAEYITKKYGYDTTTKE